MTEPAGAPESPLRVEPRGSVAGLAGAGYLAMVIGVVTGPLLARALGPGGRGEVAAAVVYSTLATSVVTFGVPLAVSNDVANRVHEPGAVLATVRRFALWAVAPSLLLAAVVVAGPLRSMSPAGRVGAAVLLAAVPVAVLAACLSLFLVGEGSLRHLARVQVVPVTAQAVATVVAYAAGVLTVASCLAIAVATVLLTAAIAWRSVGVTATSPLPLGPYVRFGLRGWLAYLAMSASIRIDQAFIGPLIGPRQLGFYAVAASLSLLPYTLARALASRAFAAVAAAEPDQRAARAAEFVRLTVLVGALVSAGIAAVSPVAVPLLYGGAFSRAVVPLLVLVPGTVLLCGSATFSSCLVSLGRPGSAMVAELSGLAITGVGLPLVVPRAGIVGAAALSSVAYVTTFLVYRHQLGRLGPVRVLPRPADLRLLGVLVHDRGPVPRRRALVP